MNQFIEDFVVPFAGFDPLHMIGLMVVSGIVIYILISID